MIREEHGIVPLLMCVCVSVHTVLMFIYTLKFL